jgi:putative membrane protein
MIGTAAVALSATMGLGTAEAASAAPVPARPSAQDITWMRSNAQTDLAEIAIGKLALAKSHNADLLKVARVTMRDHKIVLIDLRILAKKEHVKLPTTPNASQRAAAKELKSLSGRRFNLTWDNIQIAGHKLSIRQTKKEIANGSARPVVRFARDYLPIAKMHLRMAEKLHHELTH